MRPRTTLLALVTTAALALVLNTAPVAAHETQSEPPEHHGTTTPTVTELTTFAAAGCAGACGSGSTVGPDGALYVTDGPGGRVLRIDRHTGATTTYASGLPKQIAQVGIGGAMDVAFRGDHAYVLVSVVGPFFGQPDVVDGLYKVRDDGTVTPVADIGAWAIAHPPKPDFFITTGVQYALQPYRRGFLVTDGHHNRVLYVSRHGTVREVVAFDDIVPTGLARGEDGEVLMAEAGPVPHLPQNGKVVSFHVRDPEPEVVASGAPLLVDVETGCQGTYALSQGVWTLPNIPENAGRPASPDTGSLVLDNEHGGFTTVATGLDRPTSMEIVDDTAYVVTLTGKVLRIDHLGHCDDDEDDD